MPRSSYLHCPACDKRKAVEEDFDLPIKALAQISDRSIPAKRCTRQACRSTSIGDVVINRTFRNVNGKREGGFVKTPEVHKLVARLLRERARQEQRDALSCLQDAETILSYVDSLEKDKS